MTRKEERRHIYAKYEGRCAYCGKPITFKEMQVDHLEPKAGRYLNAPDLFGNPLYSSIESLENKMPSCRRCNHYKRAHPLKYFRFLITTIHERIQKIYIAKVAEDYGIVEYKPWDGLFYFEKANHADQTGK